MNKEMNTKVSLYRLVEGQDFSLTPGGDVYHVEKVTAYDAMTRVVYSLGPVRAEFVRSSLTTVYI